MNLIRANPASAVGFLLFIIFDIFDIINKTICARLVPNTKEKNNKMSGINKIYLGSDHAGFELKEKLKKYFKEKGINYQDLGTYSLDSVDYPDYAFSAAKKVAKEKNSRGILICGTGTGMVIAANKIKGIRAVAAYDKYSAEMSRLHNNTNVLGLRGRFFSFGKIKEIISIWLDTPFSGEERHKRRINKIKQFENAN